MTKKSIGKIVLIYVLSLILLFVAAGCDNGNTINGTDGTDNPGGTTDNKLKIWVPQEEIDITEDMCNIFKERNPDFKLEIDYKIMGIDASINELKKDHTAAGDIFLFPSGGISELVSAGLIFPITLHNDEMKAAHNANAIEGCSFNDYIYGVPVSPNKTSFMYPFSLHF